MTETLSGEREISQNNRSATFLILSQYFTSIPKNAAYSDIIHTISPRRSHRLNDPLGTLATGHSAQPSPTSILDVIGDRGTTRFREVDTGESDTSALDSGRAVDRD
jgi:hypothetical protein